MGTPPLTLQNPTVLNSPTEMERFSPFHVHPPQSSISVVNSYDYIPFPLGSRVQSFQFCWELPVYHSVSVGQSAPMFHFCWDLPSEYAVICQDIIPFPLGSSCHNCQLTRDDACCLHNMTIPFRPYLPEHLPGHLLALTQACVVDCIEHQFHFRWDLVPFLS